jgi:miniconductance mechanosensitive channel
MTMMVRHLQPTAEGLPLELYFFSRNKNWIPFEHLQADVFDYVLAVLPSFGLRVYQRPSDEACTENKNLSFKKYE